MKKRYLLILFIVLLAPLWEGGAEEKELSEGFKNYYMLEGIFNKWQDGFFGSKTHHRKSLHWQLVNLLGKPIQTPHNYIMVSPEGLFEKKMRCKLRYDRWLYIHGKLDIESVKKIIGKDSNIIKQWWRTTRLVSLSGKLRKFRFGRDKFGDTVELYFYSVKVHE
ncbi:MAG: hypothetical protein GY754_45785 [bacterium]|nr:hypothetical protein [bacterium]